MKRREFIKGVAVYSPALALPLMAGVDRNLPYKVGKVAYQTLCDPVSEVGPGLANTRETNFANWKKKLVLDGTCNGGENIGVPVNVNDFLTMLQNFAKSSAPKYNGMRVYFAAGDQENGNPAQLPTDQVFKLTVIFVPTKRNAAYPNPDECGDDDLSQCWWLYNNIKPFNFPMRDPYHPENDIAKRWIYNYRIYKLGGTGGLTAIGQQQTSNPQFYDTTGIWYSMTTIAGGELPNGQEDCGMINYITSRQNTSEAVTSMNIAFGAYDKSEKDFPYYQLCSQFDFYNGNSLAYFGSSNGAEFCRKKHIDFKKFHLTGGDTTDTGLPCPPNPNCNGSGF